MPLALRAVVGGLFVILASAPLAACGDSGSDEPTTIAVPGDADTIQAALDLAEPGDLVLVEPGTYREDVVVHTPDVTLRGRDRNSVVIDGEFERNNGVVVTADGVAVENLSVINHTDNGVLVSADYVDDNGDADVERYRISYVTAANNGLYGIYAFGVAHGTIEHSYASGTAGAGFYVGQCKPCDVVLTDVVAEHNTLGYQGANASGDVYVVESVFRDNRVGIVTLSETVEQLSPQSGAVFAANLVVDNAAADAPPVADSQFGVGIVVAGGIENQVTANVVRGHPGAGILLTGQGTFMPFRNEIRDNDATSNGVDVAYVVPGRPDVMALGNCFVGNRFGSSVPAAIDATIGCEESHGPGPFVTTALPAIATPPGPEPAAVPLPPAQPNRPGAATSRPTRVSAPDRPDLGALVVPG